MYECSETCVCILGIKLSDFVSDSAKAAISLQSCPWFSLERISRGANARMNDIQYCCVSMP